MNISSELLTSTVDFTRGLLLGWHHVSLELPHFSLAGTSVSEEPGIVS